MYTRRHEELTHTCYALVEKGLEHIWVLVYPRWYIMESVTPRHRYIFINHTYLIIS